MRLPAEKNSTTRAGLLAICGNPNSGKTTIFNAITGLSQKVGNYPGVTVEKVSGRFFLGKEDRRPFELIDVPGTYSLAAFSPDEYIAASALYESVDGQDRPDVLICVIDATNLRRGLYLLLQILQIGLPVVVALNMIDLAKRHKTKIDTMELSRALGGIPVVPVVGNRGQGIDRLKREAIRMAEHPFPPAWDRFDDHTERMISQLAASLNDRHRTRAELMRVIFDPSGPAEQKYMSEAQKQNGAEPVKQLLDNGRQAITEQFGSLSSAETKLLTDRAADICSRAVERETDDRKSNSERIDRYLLHPVLGPIVLVLTMTMVFQSIFSWSEPFMGFIDSIFGALAGYIEGVIPPGPLQSLLTDGVVGGVGSVLVFLPQIVILFLFIALLEDSGYMSRAAFLVDRMFRWCGLSGKSFIPMLSSFACAVPGIMATRTIEDRKLRLITIMIAPLMTCSARLPVYAIMIAAFVPYKSFLGPLNLQGLVLTSLYLLGVVVAVIVSFLLQKTVLKTECGTFMMEMPSYKVPTLRSVLIRVFHRARSFVVRAGTVIFAITIIIWALSYYPHSKDIGDRHDQQVAALNTEYNLAQSEGEAAMAALVAGYNEAQRGAATAFHSALEQHNGIVELDRFFAEESNYSDVPPAAVQALYDLHRRQRTHEQTLADMDNELAGTYMRASYLARFGRRVEPLFTPLGWDWRISMAVLASFPAREVIIATLGTIYNMGTDVDEVSSTLIDKMRQATWESGPKAGQPVFTVAVALSIVVFFALCCQCGATLVTIRHEAGRWFYSGFVFVYMTVSAYLAALVVYQLFSRAGS